MAKQEDPSVEFLHQIDKDEKEKSIQVGMTTQFEVTPEQLAAYDALKPEVKAKLGPPVYGLVMSAEELKRLAKLNGGVGSTIMCPW